MSKKEGDAAAMAAVLQYFIHQNRPYSAQDVFMNLHKEFSKAVVQKVIDQLVESQQLREKVNGKQKCYVANQVCARVVYLSLELLYRRLCVQDQSGSGNADLEEKTSIKHFFPHQISVVDPGCFIPDPDT
jgi:hypothetical protein